MLIRTILSLHFPDARPVIEPASFHLLGVPPQSHTIEIRT